MPIKWNPLKVREATDMIEKFAEETRQPLESIKAVALEALKIPNLPQYVTSEILGVIDAVDRTLGGGFHNPKGQFAFRLERIREHLPADAIKEAEIKAEFGETRSLM